jgi:prolipoprotein diacylglyceryl transferase
MWYGILFVAGFILGYFIIVPLFESYLSKNRYQPPKNLSLRDTARFLVDRMTWFIIIGAVIGMRLGHVFLYDWPYYKQHPLEIIQVWNGGLASHGGALGVIAGLALFLRQAKKWVPDLTFLRLMDFVVIPTALVGCLIRIGNFVNQEIIGTPSQLPWAVVFGNPVEGGAIIPRHPVQIYEAIAYLITFIILYSMWKKKGLSLPSGMYSGCFFILVFASRFILEFWKMELGAVIDQSTLQMGQWLSLPFILVGIALVFKQKLFIKDSEANSN